MATPERVLTAEQSEQAIIEKVNSVYQLLPALKRGAVAAVYESPKIDIPHIHELADTFARFSLLEEIYIPQNTEGIRAFVSRILELNCSDAKKDRLVKALRGLVEDSKAVTRAMPGYTVAAIKLRRHGFVLPALLRAATALAPWVETVSKRESSDAHGFHKDSALTDTELRICRTFGNKSTVYATKNGTRKVHSFNKAATSLHGKDVWHAVPIVLPFTRRTMAVFELVKNS